MSLKGKKITLGLTGGIACYKVPYLVRDLVREGCQVQVVMTEAATKFITPLTLETVSGHPVGIDMFPTGGYTATRHIDLAQKCDLLVVAPATANFIGKAANGICDDLVTTTFCACDKPVLVAPAMNPVMWSNPAVQRNFERLKELGHHFVGPNEGEMACESTGVGRMAEPDQILAAIRDLLEVKKKSLSGKRFIVTAGPSREPIDPVRFISNHSSGKMGYAIAMAAVARGAETVLITGPTHLKPPVGVRVISFQTTEGLHRAVSREFRKADCLIMAAAPADYRPEKVSRKKIKKQAEARLLSLEPTVDVLKSVAATKRQGQIVIGFALETDRAVDNARRKLVDKNLDLIVLNEVGPGTGFDNDTNRVTIIRPRKRPEPWPLMGKTEIATRLVDLIASLM